MAKLAADANAANLGSYEQIAAKVNAANYIQMMDQIRKGFPGYDGTILNIGNMIGDQTKGVVPRDVINNLTQFGAERGVNIGQGVDSPNTTAALMKAFYDTSQDQQKTGMANYATMMGSVPRTSLLDVSKMFTDPNQLYEANLLANTIAASPNPYARAQEEMNRLREGVGSGSSATGPNGRSTPQIGGSDVNELLKSIIGQYQGRPAPGPTAVYGTRDLGGDTSSGYTGPTQNYYNPAPVTDPWADYAGPGMDVPSSQYDQSTMDSSYMDWLDPYDTSWDDWANGGTDMFSDGF
jgi:hypothetical protein